MNCVLFAKLDKVLSLKKTFKKYWKMAKNAGKVREKSRNFVTAEKWEPCHIFDHQGKGTVNQSLIERFVFCRFVTAETG